MSQPEQPTFDGGAANPTSTSGEPGFRTLLAIVTRNCIILLDIEAVGDILDPAYYVGKHVEDSDKMTLITKKWVAPLAFTFPLTNGRRYSPRWEKDFDWLRYSRSCDSAFCAHCISFANPIRGQGAGKGTSSMEVFQSSGFRDWKNAMGKKRGMLFCHDTSDIHKEATVKVMSFKSVTGGTTPDICSQLSDAYHKNVLEKREILLSIIDVVVVLAQRNIPFRGHNWNKETKREDGNFDFFIHWKSKFDPVLQSHLSCYKRNASYLSCTIQNELISLAGDEVKDTILDSARSARWFSVMADECTDIATIEQMAICVRFVGNDYCVREEFIGFIGLEKVDAESISVAIIEYLKKCDLNLNNLRGQGYDGASVMCGHVNGVSTRMQRIQPRA